VLFTDGMEAGLNELRGAWKLPGRALLFGMPLTFAGISLLARWLGGLGWTEAFLVGAVLSPTDPVFAAAIVGRTGVPARLRHLLNVESGLNDGLALPVVVVLLAVSAAGPVNPTRLAGDLFAGVALGIAIPYVFTRLERTKLFSSSALYEPLGPFSVGLTLLAICPVTGANAFLGAFVGGMTMATVNPAARDAFHRFGELITELFKLAAILAFGALVTPSLLAGVGAGGWIFAASAIVLARPVAIVISLHRSSMAWREQVSTAWFGPKGFASVVYGLLVLESSIHAANRIFTLTVVTVAVSMIVHSSSDIIVARWLEKDLPEGVAELP
jgi:NhaP-type Na+/H+ or K+/H+ antiporter